MAKQRQQIAELRADGLNDLADRLEAAADLYAKHTTLIVNYLGERELAEAEAAA